jgi:hypothetical protein
MSTRRLSIASTLLWCLAAGCSGYVYDGARREQNVQQRLIPYEKGLVHGHGMSIRLPGGWTGVIYKRGALPVPHAASFKLPPVDGDDGATRAVPRMHADDVLLVMLQGEPKFAGNPRGRLPIQLRSSDVGAPVEGMPLSHAFARVDFTYRRRAYDLWVEFGSKPARPKVVREANRVIASLRLTP